MTPKLKAALDEFERALQQHDWYYDYSDDSRVWRRGNNQRIELDSMLKLLHEMGAGREADQLWGKHSPYKEIKE